MSNLMLFSIHNDQAEDSVDGIEIDVDNRLIRASAGTGKTYQLTSRYLRLLLQGATPESILATTFTRKAAGEILDRVVQRLAAAAGDARELEHLAIAVEMPALSLEMCQEKLQLLTRQMHRLRIYTLDAFFMQLAMSFSFELGLTPGWQILQDAAEISTLKSEAIGDVLRLEDLDSLLTLVHQLTPKGTAKRSLSALLESQVNDAYNLFLDSKSAAWDMLPVPSPLPEQEVDELREALVACVVKGKQIPAARDEDVNRIAAKNWRGFFDQGKTLVRNILDGKTKYGNANIPEDMLVLYKKLLQHLQAQILQMSAGQTRSTRDFLEKYDQQFRRIKSEQQLCEFDDVTRLLAEHAQTRDLQTLAYRMDAGIDHLLLDEFQDTSIPQWRALVPLADRATKEPQRSFFCVGDVKQAIYGWRGATSEIFDLLDERLPGLELDSLQQSRRSSQVVIDAVNQVFEHLPNWDRLQRGRRAAQKWPFPKHTTVHADMPGCVTLEVADAGEDYGKFTQDTMVFQLAASRVAAIAKQVPGRTIGVLCRTNHVVARLMHELQRNRVSASEEGGNFLTDSAAVELVLSLLHLADHPSDSTSAFHLASSSWGPTLGLAVDLSLPATTAVAGDATTTSKEPVQQRIPRGGVDPMRVRKLARQVRQRLQNDGYGSTLRDWSDQLRPFCNRRESRRLDQLVEKGYEFQNRIESPRHMGYERQSRTSIRPTAFERHIRETKFSDPSADTIRVMTVHQAKGLQFDVVVLPDLIQPFVGTNDAFLYRRPTIDSEVDLVCRYIGKDRGRAFLPDDFQPLFDEHEDRKTRESLSVLYVAMTRAVHALHMFVPAGLPSASGGRENTAYLVKDALCPDAKMEPSVTLYEAGDKHWFLNEKLPEVPAVELEESLTPTPQLAKRRSERRYLETIAPSQLGESQHVHLSDRLARNNYRARDFGTLTHLWLSEVRWIADGQGWPSNERLKQLSRTCEGSVDLKHAQKKFQDFKSHPELTQVLQQHDYVLDLRSRLDKLPERFDLEVRNEQPVAGRDESAVVTGTVDRLVLLRVDGKIIGADIIDYKTELLLESDQDVDVDVQERKRERYVRQMEAYRKVIASSLRLPESRIGTRLVLL